MRVAGEDEPEVVDDAVGVELAGAVHDEAHANSLRPLMMPRDGGDDREDRRDDGLAEVHQASAAAP